jgi:hypothetical protein
MSLSICRDFLLDTILPFLTNRQLYPLRFINRIWKRLIEVGVAKGQLARPVLYGIMFMVEDLFFSI